MKKLDTEFRFRKKKSGPEMELINNFLNSFDINILKLRNNLDILILEEPNIVNNYPDIILISYDKSKICYWNKTRESLTNNDIKIIHHLYSSNQMKTIGELLYELGFSKGELEKIVIRLINANMIKEQKNRFGINNICEIFFISDIISIEAKINNWKQAFYQAEINNLFSTESYILLPDKIFNTRLKNNMSKNKIGIITNNNGINKIEKRSKLNDIPNSYYSWILNEKIGRAINDKSIRC